ncbi:hypothetical protein GLAREA_11347 [Glarea lozoyensis ATCC 20868]|uniref:Uncharacterized protein n=1 Tax=Glarea lozoyensis (strain ATCC 20868 / MF5171) TaxID=1116229 RepID=S3DAZ6_GLAL2|nr:uncharacterized protein GLAREA_11347 [Glarea lozoyensis ATCC 20868]EPE35647.1 hypothetical protein GLAREA_11347 [Glarea lozoyensis ATCC 20868]
MDWDEDINIATRDREYSSSSAGSLASVKTSGTFGNVVREKPRELRASYDSTFSASPTWSGASSQLSSPVLSREERLKTSYYDIDDDCNSSSDLDFSEDEHADPSDASIEAIARSYLRTAPATDGAVGIRKVVLDIFELVQSQNSHLFDREENHVPSTCVPLDMEIEICTALLLHSSPSSNLEKYCEDHLVRIASGKGSIMSSGTTESHFDVWLEDENSHLVYGWQIHAQIYRLMALRDTLQIYLESTSKALDGASLSVASAVQRREEFLNDVLKIPVEVLLKVEIVRNILRPVEIG